MSKRLNAKLIILQYFDSLIQCIDIFTEELLQTCSDSDRLTILRRENCARKKTQNESLEKLDFENVDAIWKHEYNKIWNSMFKMEYNYESNILVTENDLTINKIDYLNQAREEMLAELANGQEEAFKRYEMIKNDLKRDIDENQENLMAQLFANKFYILVEFESREMDKSQHLVVLDFYLNKQDLFKKYFYILIILVEFSKLL